MFTFPHLFCLFLIQVSLLIFISIFIDLLNCGDVCTCKMFRKKVVVAVLYIFLHFFCLMGNDLQAYRAAIGTFYTCLRKTYGSNNYWSDTYQNIFMTYLRCSFHFAALLLLQGMYPNVNILFILFEINLLLIIGEHRIKSRPRTP